MRVVLGYSGGLDTSVIAPWRRETYDAEVVRMAGDVGQRGGLEGLEAKVLASFGESSYDHGDAGGFIKLFSLPVRMEAGRRNGAAPGQDGNIRPAGPAPRPRGRRGVPAGAGIPGSEMG